MHGVRERGRERDEAGPVPCAERLEVDLHAAHTERAGPPREFVGDGGTTSGVGQQGGPDRG